MLTSHLEFNAYGIRNCNGCFFHRPRAARSLRERISSVCRPFHVLAFFFFLFFLLAWQELIRLGNEGLPEADPVYEKGAVEKLGVGVEK